MSNSRYHSISIGQGWAQDLLGRDRDQDRDLSSRDRDETETFAKLPETRLRRDPRVSETRPRRDLFLVETRLIYAWYRYIYIYNYIGIYIYAWYIYTSHCVPKKESLRLGWKKQVKNEQSLILKIPKTFMFLFKLCVLQCFTQIPYCHYNLKTCRYKHRKGPKRTEKDRKGTDKGRKGRTYQLFTEKEAKSSRWNNSDWKATGSSAN